jgi:hypothetical protein
MTDSNPQLGSSLMPTPIRILLQTTVPSNNDDWGIDRLSMLRDYLVSLQHSGRNGDYQRITPVEPIHPLLRNPAAPSGLIALFPSHPHEGGVGVASPLENRVIIVEANRNDNFLPSEIIPNTRLQTLDRVGSLCAGTASSQYENEPLP